MPKNLTSIPDAIAFLGGPSKAARKLKRSRQTIYNWLGQDSLPPDADTIREFEDTVKEHGGRIPRRVLNPELYA